MFTLLRSVDELLFDAPTSLSNECFEYLSSSLCTISKQLIQESFSIALRVKRTRLLGDDFQSVLKYRALCPLFGYCCSSTDEIVSSFQTVHQGPRRFFLQADRIIDISQGSPSMHSDRLPTVTHDEILLHVEWLAIAGEQHNGQLRAVPVKTSLLRQEQQLYLSFVQSKHATREIWNGLSDDELALNTSLADMTEWCRTNIRECLLHNCRAQKRRQLMHYLTTIESLLANPSSVADHYLPVWVSIVIRCLLYQFEVRTTTYDRYAYSSCPFHQFQGRRVIRNCYPTRQIVDTARPCMVDSIVRCSSMCSSTATFKLPCLRCVLHACHRSTDLCSH